MQQSWNCLMQHPTTAQVNEPVNVFPWNLVEHSSNRTSKGGCLSSLLSWSDRRTSARSEETHDSDWVLLDRGHNCSKQKIAKGSSKTFWLITHWLMTCKTNIYELVLQDVVRMFRRKEIARFPFDATGWEAAYEKEIELREDFSRYNCWGLYLKERE